MTSSFYFHKSKYSNINGNTIEDKQENIHFKQNKGKLLKKNKGRIVEDREISETELKKYMEEENISRFNDPFFYIIPYIDTSLFNLSPKQHKKKNRLDQLSLEEPSTIEEINKSTKTPLDLTPSNKLKHSKLSKREINTCESIIRYFGLDPKNAKKEDIKDIYISLKEQLTKECDEIKDKKSKEYINCSNKLNKLNENIKKYNSC